MFCSLQAFSCAKFVGDIFRFNYFLKQLARHKKKITKKRRFGPAQFPKTNFQVRSPRPEARQHYVA
jgi:hypothetical protein